jgi:hypothetical protein
MLYPLFRLYSVECYMVCRLEVPVRLPGHIWDSGWLPPEFKSYVLLFIENEFVKQKITGRFIALNSVVLLSTLLVQ